MIDKNRLNELYEWNRYALLKPKEAKELISLALLGLRVREIGLAALLLKTSLNPFDYEFINKALSEMPKDKK